MLFPGSVGGGDGGSKVGKGFWARLGSTNVTEDAPSHAAMRPSTNSPPSSPVVARLPDPVLALLTDMARHP
jgi:hypothetical protein